VILTAQLLGAICMSLRTVVHRILRSATQLTDR